MGGSFGFICLVCAAKRWGLLALVLITWFIPLGDIILIIALTGFFIYGGLKGKSILYASNRYTNHDQKIGAIKALEMVGGSIAVMMLLGGIAFILLLIA